MKTQVSIRQALLNLSITLYVFFSFVMPAKADTSKENGATKQSFQAKPILYDFCGNHSWQRRSMVCRPGQTGKGYAVCENYLKFLNQSLPKLSDCEIPTPPNFKKPEWEEMDIKSNLQLAYEAEVMRFSDNALIQKPDFEAWKKQILGEIAAGAIVPRMRRARITPTNKGEVTILGYTRDSTGCEKVDRGISDDVGQVNNYWRSFISGYIHYILTAQGTLQKIPGNFGSVSAVQRELLLYEDKPYFASTFGGEGKYPPREIFSIDQPVTSTNPRPEYLYTNLLCQFRTVDDPSSTGR